LLSTFREEQAWFASEGLLAGYVALFFSSTISASTKHAPTQLKAMDSRAAQTPQRIRIVLRGRHASSAPLEPPFKLGTIPPSASMPQISPQTRDQKRAGPSFVTRLK
jgi:hypothetical protein